MHIGENKSLLMGNQYSFTYPEVNSAELGHVFVTRLPARSYLPLVLDVGRFVL